MLNSSSDTVFIDKQAAVFIPNSALAAVWNVGLLLLNNYRMYLQNYIINNAICITNISYVVLFTEITGRDFFLLGHNYFTVLEPTVDWKFVFIFANHL